MEESSLDFQKSRLNEIAKKKGENKYVYLGLLVAPLVMYCYWVSTHNKAFVLNVGIMIFCISCVVYLIGFILAQRNGRHLDGVRQRYSLPTNDYLGNASVVYKVEYQFELFTLEQFDAYRRLHFWTGIHLGALFCIFGWVAASFVFEKLV